MDIFVLDLLILGKSLSDYTNVFSPKEYGKNDKIILKYFHTFQIENIYCIIYGKYRRSKNPKGSYIFEKKI